MKWSEDRRAFSLVEVVVALGLVSFVMVALVGLMSSGLQTSKRSQDDMALSLAVKQSMADLQTNASLSPGVQHRWFDYQGMRQAQAGQAYYTNTMTLSQGTNSLWNVTMTFTWPGQSQTNGPYARVFCATIQEN